ncbi:E3 SUMO-protein ligase NSE2, putative [Plasmodium ovale]|uniref:E3 SUMO-protein ligase NSE2, putative n=1 Tax=Plasmodium ovale TaxID=36330 RepID=A0A1D3TLC5_PLAOA|nr:E3 SUMO-protein ligase NSE2, putative [Plasmodium ovale]
MHKKGDSRKKDQRNTEDALSEEDDTPYFKEIWDDLDKYEEEYIPSQEILKYHSHLQKSLYNILFSIKYFRSDEINIDTKFLKLVNKFVKLKLQGNQTDEKDISRLARFHLKSQKEDDDEEELVVDEEVGVFPTKCPISQMPFENPVTQRFSKNRKACVHTFEKSFIIRLMQNKDTIECPIAACKKKVYKNSLHPDYEFLHHARYKKFRDYITEAREYFVNLRNDEGKSFDFVE